MVFLLIKFFAEITYQWITVTQPLLQQPHFHPSLCPTRAWGLLGERYSRAFSFGTPSRLPAVFRVVDGAERRHF
jgi:hypothetical protein